MKSSIQLKYSNYVAFSHFHGTTVNNSGLISGVLFLFCLIVFIIPAFFDIPNVLNKKYLEVSGVVESWDYSDELLVLCMLAMKSFYQY